MKKSFAKKKRKYAHLHCLRPIKVNQLLAMIVLLCLCGCKSSNLPSVATDALTRQALPPHSYMLPEGKICFVSSPIYPAMLPNNSSFKEQEKTEGMYAFKGILEIRYPEKEKAVIDTVIQSRFLTTHAIEAAVRFGKIPHSVSIPDYEYHATDGKLDLPKLLEEQKPDVLVDLSRLQFRIAGNKEMCAYILSTIPNRVYNDINSDSYIRPNNPLSGNVSIHYVALWHVVEARSGKLLKKIQMEGIRNTAYSASFDLPTELDKCAEKAGKDFASLLKK